MCLITNKKSQVATEDIVVYKELQNNLCSIFQGFPYDLGKSYFTEIKEAPTGAQTPYCSIDQNYLYDTFKEFDGLEKAISANIVTVYEQGFHSISSQVYEKWLIMEKRCKDSVVAKCIIPTGATYIEDFVGFIVSNQIIIVERVQGSETI